MNRDWTAGLSGDSTAVREGLLSRLATLSCAQAALFCRLEVDPVDGATRVLDVFCHGPGSFQRACLYRSGTPLFADTEVDTKIVGQLTAAIAHGRPYLFASDQVPILPEDVSEALGIASAMGVFLTTAEGCLGWVGLFRVGLEPAFQAADVASLTRLLPRLSSRLRDAQSADEGAQRLLSEAVLLLGPDATLIEGCEPGRRWLAIDAHRRRLAHYLQVIRSHGVPSGCWCRWVSRPGWPGLI